MDTEAFRLVSYPNDISRTFRGHSGLIFVEYVVMRF